MDIEVVFSGVPVTELAAAQDFFERLFGASPDIIVNENEVMWRLADAAWLYVVVDAVRAGDALVAVSVPDLDAALAEIAARGIEPAHVERVGEAERKATVTDPDGNTVALIEVRAGASG
ncbi:MAG TPA: VOC family protein [Acidimicrobiales bacterium]